MQPYGPRPLRQQLAEGMSPGSSAAWSNRILPASLPGSQGRRTGVRRPLSSQHGLLSAVTEGWRQ